jgi:stalled ribosome rescue protein Dom34
MDHEEARVFEIDPKHTGVVTIEAPHRHIRHAQEVELAGGGEPPPTSSHFFRDIAKALEGAEEVLVTGPAASKLGFLKFVHAHDPALEPRIVGVETIAFAGDKQLLRYAQDYFKLSDPMR